MASQMYYKFKNLYCRRISPIMCFYCLPVMLQPVPETGGDTANYSKHKFLVQSIKVNKEMTVDQLEAVVRNTSKEDFMCSKLSCLFINELNDDSATKEVSNHYQ